MEARPSPFLGLPVELRLRIYDYVGDGKMVLFLPPSLHSGLLGTCREIRSELEPELIAQAVRWLKDNAPNLDDEYLDPRTFESPTLETLRHLVLLTTPEWEQGNCVEFESHSFKLHSLNLKSLTVKTYGKRVCLSTVSRPHARELSLEKSTEKGWGVSGYFTCFSASNTPGFKKKEGNA
ncbi:hypothetical protein K491DRAFT_688919 [Lophiostoma macrostomum CBS 122681]|uniref:Uncharacterized protein n=1 Tax=Lophiostoma macrostomum CBS 122681 TaxID=1314788 RepID=A0A6A6TJA9_9PLEO|nr:hypothetical protein K491DRAFT_688919 [Lophiostoma macrostomum CBS 122681]